MDQLVSVRVASEYTVEYLHHLCCYCGSEVRNKPPEVNQIWIACSQECLDKLVEIDGGSGVHPCIAEGGWHNG